MYLSLLLSTSGYMYFIPVMANLNFQRPLAYSSLQRHDSSEIILKKKKLKKTFDQFNMF